jgi:type VI protein secretion system component VasK
MRVLGLAGVVLALAIVGYLIVGYLGEAGKAQDALQALPGSEPGRPADVSRRGLEQRLSPILDQERQRIEATSKAAGQ